jgi:hypothetical protein
MVRAKRRLVKLISQNSKSVSVPNKLRVSLTIAIVMLFLCISNVFARGGAYIIEPNQEIIDLADLTLKGTVRGNISVTDGFIDFYVTSPSDELLLSYNKTAFTDFKFDIKENGVYRLHLANTYSEKKVNVTLAYGVDFVVVLQESVGVTMGMASVAESTQAISAFPNLIDWVEFVKLLSGSLSLVGIAKKIYRWISGYLMRRRWKKKYGKSRTPIDILARVYRLCRLLSPEGKK